MHYVLGQDDRLLAWAAPRLPHIGDPASLLPAKAVGIAAGDQPSDPFYGVIIYNMYQPAYRSCMISMVATDPHWCTRPVIKTLLNIPFYQYNCNRVWTIIPHTSSRVIRFNKVLGFTQEGVLREAFGLKLHGVVCGMLRRDYERRYYSGKRQPLTAAVA